MDNITAMTAISSNPINLRAIGGCLLVSSLGFILSRPFQEIHQVNVTCETDRVPATLITNATGNNPSQCPVMAMESQASAS